MSTLISRRHLQGQEDISIGDIDHSDVASIGYEVGPHFLQGGINALNRHLLPCRFHVTCPRPVPF